MKLLNMPILALALAPLPLAAQSLNDTHDMRWAPSGKVPSVTYHYRGKNNARTAANCAATTVSSNTAKNVNPAKGGDCNTRVALEVRSDRTVAQD
jgi:hypothetical protein